MGDGVWGLVTLRAEVPPGPAHPSHGSRSGMSSTRIGVGPVWSGRVGEGKSPPLPPRGLMRMVVMMKMMMLMRRHGNIKSHGLLN